MDIKSVQQKLRAFAQERDWDVYHTPKNLVMALTGEVGELAEIFQWLSPDEAAAIMTTPRQAENVRDELADILTYVLRLSDILGVDLAAAVEQKIAKNAEKYPVLLAKGNAKKYSDFNKGS